MRLLAASAKSTAPVLSMASPLGAHSCACSAGPSRMPSLPTVPAMVVTTPDNERTTPPKMSGGNEEFASPAFGRDASQHVVLRVGDNDAALGVDGDAAGPAERGPVAGAVGVRRLPAAGQRRQRAPQLSLPGHAPGRIHRLEQREGRLL